MGRGHSNHINFIRVKGRSRCRVCRGADPGVEATLETVMGWQVKTEDQLR